MSKTQPLDPPRSSVLTPYHPLPFGRGDDGARSFLAFPVPLVVTAPHGLVCIPFRRLTAAQRFALAHELRLNRRRASDARGPAPATARCSVSSSVAST